MNFSISSLTSLFEVSAVVIAADKVFGITYKDGRVYSGGARRRPWRR